MHPESLVIRRIPVALTQVRPLAQIDGVNKPIGDEKYLTAILFKVASK